MGWRVAPNKGQIEFPAVLNARVTAAVKDYVARKGGGSYVRWVLEAAMKDAETPRTHLLNANKIAPRRRAKPAARPARKNARTGG